MYPNVILRGHIDVHHIVEETTARITLCVSPFHIGIYIQHCFRLNKSEPDTVISLTYM